MKTVKVNASKPYKVLIGANLLENAGKLIAETIKGRRAVIVTDDRVNHLYSSTLQASLEKQGFCFEKFVIPHGEASKNADNYLKLLCFLSKSDITRDDAVIALGGGVTGDIAGFAASTYMRGIRFIQIPTSLLAMVDSSVGGKTAINLEAGKNLAGTFYQPDLVICDYSVLKTLCSDEMLNGCAEIIKYAVIKSNELFDCLYDNGIDFEPEYVISECVKLKRDIIEKDEYDINERLLLNFGHTIGHAVELCSDYKTKHGKAVAIGMAIIAKAGVAEGICSDETAMKIIGLLKHFGLPVSTEYTARQLSDAAANDKKRRGNTLKLVVVNGIGCCGLHEIEINELYDFIRKGLRT